MAAVIVGVQEIEENGWQSMLLDAEWRSTFQDNLCLRLFGELNPTWTAAKAKGLTVPKSVETRQKTSAAMTTNSQERITKAKEAGAEIAIATGKHGQRQRGEVVMPATGAAPSEGASGGPRQEPPATLPSAAAAPSAGLGRGPAAKGCSQPSSTWPPA